MWSLVGSESSFFGKKSIWYNLWQPLCLLWKRGHEYCIPLFTFVSWQYDDKQVYNKLLILGCLVNLCMLVWRWHKRFNSFPSEAEDDKSGFPIGLLVSASIFQDCWTFQYWINLYVEMVSSMLSNKLSILGSLVNLCMLVWRWQERFNAMLCCVKAFQ